MSATEMATGLPLRRILALGSSEVTFDGDGQEMTVPRLLAAELSTRMPDFSWQVEPRVVYQMANMADRCVRYAEEVSPDAILLWLGGTAIAEETVSYAIYRRFPRFYRHFDRIANASLSASGGGTEGSASFRGLLFRLPRSLAGLVFGRAPLCDPEVARKATVETLEQLSCRWPVVCRLAFAASRQAGQALAVRKQVAQYNAAMATECERLGLPYYEPAQEALKFGVNYAMGPDGLHADLASRRAAALVAARYLVQALESKGTLTDSERKSGEIVLP
jgi:hypothetical protein